MERRPQGYGVHMGTTVHWVALASAKVAELNPEDVLLEEEAEEKILLHINAARVWTMVA